MATYTDPVSARDAEAEAKADARWEQQMGNAERDYELSKEIFGYNKAQDDLRKKNVGDSMAEIKTIFDGRAPIYGNLRDESYGLNEARLTDLQGDAERNTRFALARAGNIGGSTEVDKNREMAEKMGLGIGQAEIYAQGQSDQLRAQDESLRSSLSSMAATGGLTGSQVGAQGKAALSGLKGNASYMRNIDNTFDNTSGTIGSAGKKNVQQPRTSSTQFGY